MFFLCHRIRPPTVVLLNAAAIERCLGCPCACQAAVAIGKQQHGIAVALPETAQESVGGRRQRHQAILVALGIADRRTRACTVDVGNGQPQPFAKAQAETVEREEEDRRDN